MILRVPAVCVVLMVFGYLDLLWPDSERLTDWNARALGCLAGGAVDV